MQDSEREELLAHLQKHNDDLIRYIQEVERRLFEQKSWIEKKQRILHTRHPGDTYR